MSLKKLTPLYLLILTLPLSVFSQEIDLQGTQIIGDKKSATVSIEGNSLIVGEGDSVGSWKIERIESRIVELRSKDSNEIKMLSLHSRPSPETSTQESVPSPDKPAEQTENAQALLPTVIAPPPPEKIAEGVYRSEHFIEDEDVPPGYYKKRTPFGDFLIKNEAILK